MSTDQISLVPEPEPELTAPQKREKAAEVIGDLKRALPCPCTVMDCPFRNSCELCIRNHLIDGHLSACALPDHPYRQDTDTFPRCRTPLLWILHYAENPTTFAKDVVDAFPDKAKKEILDALKTLRAVTEGITSSATT